MQYANAFNYDALRLDTTLALRHGINLFMEGIMDELRTRYMFYYS